MRQAVGVEVDVRGDVTPGQQHLAHLLPVRPHARRRHDVTGTEIVPRGMLALLGHAAGTNGAHTLTVRRLPGESPRWGARIGQDSLGTQAQQPGTLRSVLSKLSTNGAQSETVILATPEDTPKEPARRWLRPPWVALGGFAVGLASVAGAVVLAHGSLALDQIAQPATQPRCVYTSIATTCVAADSHIEASRVSNLVTGYVELLQEFGLNPPTRFFLTGSSAAPSTYVALAVPAGSSSPTSTLNQQIAAGIAGPRPCARSDAWVRTVVQARALLASWLLRQVTGSVSAKATAARRSWLVSDQSSQWVLTNYAAIANCDRAVKIPELNSAP